MSDADAARRDGGDGAGDVAVSLAAPKFNCCLPHKKVTERKEPAERE